MRWYFNMGFNEGILKIRIQQKWTNIIKIHRCTLYSKYEGGLLSATCYFIINAKAGLKHEWFNTYYGIKTNKYVQTSLIYIDVIDAQ